MHLSSSSVIILALTLITVESRVCKTIDVRNTPESISEFKDCRVIEGYLRVVLMERNDMINDFSNNNFAELHEITDYLIVFKVKDLVSLNDIFPKLTYIRGNNLFLGYSLVLFEVHDLEEIGLKSLRTIQNGAVRIEKCLQLCYVDSVNWSALGVTNVTYNNQSDCTDQYCPDECKGYCWNKLDCQDLTPRINCHPFCIGCTKGDSPKHCISCKYFNNSGTCVKTCQAPKIPDDHSASCVSVRKCISKGSSWAVDNDRCIEKCAPLYERNSTGYCHFTGVKYCGGTTVTTYNDLYTLINCTHITGSLQISNTEYISSEFFYDTLSNIVSISKYLLIFRSKTIISLDCFKRLETIKGEGLWSRYYALFVVENPNLRRLFSNTSLAVINGETLFYDNPYLCQSEIDRFADLKITNISTQNGYETSCNTIDLNVTSVEVNPNNITLTWPVPPTNETVIGYIFFYKIIDDPNTSCNSTLLQNKDGIMDNEDFLFRNVWSRVFLTNNTAKLTRLLPYYCYAFFIRTKFASQTVQETPLYYFRASSSEPSEPESFEITPNNISSFELSWKLPKFVNGPLSYYKLAVYLEKDYLPMIRQRNYCLHPHIECNCQIKEETRVFIQPDGCFGNRDPHYCTNKTLYDTSPPKITIHLNTTNPEVQEFEINTTVEVNKTQILLASLKHFTAYTLYLRACNQEQCGSPVALTQRTLAKEDADVVTDTTVETLNHKAMVSWSEPQSPNSVTVAYHVEYRRTDVQNSKSRIRCVTRNFLNFSLNEGQFAVRVLAVSLAGPGVWGEWRQFRIGGVRSDWGYGVLGVLGVIVLGILGFAIGRKYKMVKLEENDHLVFRNAAFTGEISDGDEWKLDEETIRIVGELRQESVGVVFRNVKI